MIPDTAPTFQADGDAYRDLRDLLPDEPSFSRILRRMIATAAGRVVSAEEQASKLPKKEQLKRAKARFKRQRAFLLSIATRPAA